MMVCIDWLYPQFSIIIGCTYIGYYKDFVGKKSKGRIPVFVSWKLVVSFGDPGRTSLCRPATLGLCLSWHFTSWLGVLRGHGSNDLGQCVAVLPGAPWSNSVGLLVGTGGRCKSESGHTSLVSFEKSFWNWLGIIMESWSQLLAKLAFFGYVFFFLCCRSRCELLCPWVMYLPCPGF